MYIEDIQDCIYAHQLDYKNNDFAKMLYVMQKEF